MMESRSFLFVAEKIDSLQLSPPTNAMAHGILLGDKQQFTYSEKQEMRDAGMSHIMAVSGLHIGILFLVLYFALHPMRWIGQRTMHRLVVISCIWLYVAMIGCPVSAVRAAMMLTVATLSWVMQRNTSGLRLLATTAVLMLAFDYHQLTDVGFLLSFLATLGILMVNPKLAGVNPVVRLLMVTLSAQIMTLPVVAYYFHVVTIFGWVQGLLVIPLLSVLVYLLLFYLLFPAFTLLARPIEWISDWIFLVADCTNRLETFILGGRMALYPEWWEAMLMELIILACAYYINVSKDRRLKNLWQQ